MCLIAAKGTSAVHEPVTFALSGQIISFQVDRGSNRNCNIFASKIFYAVISTTPGVTDKIDEKYLSHCQWLQSLSTSPTDMLHAH